MPMLVVCWLGPFRGTPKTQLTSLEPVAVRGEAGYIVPDPLNADITYGGEYDGQFSMFNKKNREYRMISVYPEQHFGAGAEDRVDI